MLALIPDDVDVCVAIDLDEVLTAGWRMKLDAEWGDANRGKYSYTWSHHPDGSPAVTYTYDRIHSRHGYRWRHPCHETLYPDRIEQVDAQLSLELHHWPDPNKPRSQYLELLEVAADEQSHDSRNAHYFGRELMFNGQWARAVNELRRHLELPTSTWMPERAASMRFVARCLTQLGQPDDALVWFRVATDTAPDTREPWVELAQACHDQERWHECYDAAVAALRITERPGIYINDASAWAELPDDLASVAAWHLGLRGEALVHAERAATLAPNDSRIAANVAFYQNVVE